MVVATTYVGPSDIAPRDRAHSGLTLRRIAEHVGLDHEILRRRLRGDTAKSADVWPRHNRPMGQVRTWPTRGAS
jgi:hypothetical protein